jgi:hypothetical protein
MGNQKKKKVGLFEIYNEEMCHCSRILVTGTVIRQVELFATHIIMQCTLLYYPVTVT